MALITETQKSLNSVKLIPAAGANASVSAQNVTLTGAKKGDVVVKVLDYTTAATGIVDVTADFEKKISASGFIKQLLVDLSAKPGLLVQLKSVP